MSRRHSVFVETHDAAALSTAFHVRDPLSCVAVSCVQNLGDIMIDLSQILGHFVVL